ncbi:MAG TPA: sigma-70 family RNA polymerase sigma factor [Candidatus Polarisedimenticolia bacterium]|nr:sigma-70 family RNA polymerase sigma factor [Candidatus Polarisedimenticolia bacterium]
MPIRAGPYAAGAMVDERSLIRQSREGDQRAFEQLVNLKREKAFRIAFNIVGDEDDARDVAQLAFIRLWRSLSQFDENSRFDPWFFRIVVNLAIDSYRRTQKEPRPVEPAGKDEEAAEGGLPAQAAPGADADLMRGELRAIFNRLATGLAPAQRAVFTLKEIEGMGTDEIAKVMGIRASTVRNHLLQARRVLQDGLRRAYPEYCRGRGPR